MTHIVWDMDPEILKWGPLTIRWYGLCFASAFLSGCYLVGRSLREDKVLGDPKTLELLLIYIAVGTVVGARLGHCLFYEPGYYLSHPVQILMIWQGGLASHGGGIGIFLALFIFSRRHLSQGRYLWLLDQVAPAVPLGGALIRLGNLFNSEIFGRPTDSPWAFVFKQIDNLPRHPTQLYESLSYLAIFVFLQLVVMPRKDRYADGGILGCVLVAIFSARFVIEFFKENQVAFEAHLPLTMGQLLSLPVIALGLFLLSRSSRKA